MRRRALLLLLVAAVPLFFVNLGGSSIWDANEAFYVETPRQMIARGDYIVPFFNDEPRLNKPVLSYWIVAGLYQAFGVSVAVQRFGIAIGGLVIIASAFCLGWLLANDRPDGRPAKAGLYRAGAAESALLAAVGLAVDPRLVMFSRRIFIDIWITAFMALTLTFFAMSEHFPHRRRLFLLLMYVSIGLGVLTKGPIAALLPALAFTLYLALRRELRRVREMMLPAGLLIVLTIVLPWYVALYQRAGWTPIVSFFVGENVGRYTSGIGFPTARGLGFYLPVIFADAFPLSLFLIPAGVLFWTNWRSSRREPRHQAPGTGHQAPGTWHSAQATNVLLWSWIAVIVTFFSFSHDKQDLYILPIVSAVAALGASAISRRDEAPRTVRATAVILGLLLAAGGGVVLYVFEVLRPPYPLANASLVGVVGAAGGTVATIFAISRRLPQSLIAALATLLIVNWLLVVRILSDLEQHKPVPVLTAFLRERIAPEDVLSTFNVALPSLAYYLQRHVNVHYSPKPFAADATAHQRMFGILTEQDYAALDHTVRAQTCVLTRVPAFEVKLKHVFAGAARPNLVLITNHCEAD